MEKIIFDATDFIKDTEQKESEINEANGIVEFPINVFPEMFKNLISECKEFLNYPIDYTGVAILTSVATSIGTTAKVRVKKDWFEFASLFVGIIGKAGANKSHPLSTAFDVFTSIDKKALNEFEPLINQYEDYQKLSKKDKDQCTPVARPKLLKSILHNYTPEILLQRLADNQRGCTVVSDELATFMELMSNYSKGNQESTYLSLWSNKSTSIDRVGKTLPLFIQQPFLNVIGGLQPRVLKRLFPPNKTDNGFLQRFLFAFPDDCKKQPLNENERDTSAIAEYNQFIIDYIERNQIVIDGESGNVNSKIYYWSNDAKKFFFKWQERNTIEVNKNDDNLKGEILTKYDNHFVRLALILQIMENSNTNEIGINAVKGADALCKYFIYTAFKVLDILNEPIVPNEVLPSNKLKYYEALPNEFTTSEAVKFGLGFSIPERTVKHFLTDKDYFENTKYGHYKKKH